MSASIATRFECHLWTKILVNCQSNRKGYTLKAENVTNLTITVITAKATNVAIVTIQAKQPL